MHLNFFLQLKVLLQTKLLLSKELSGTVKDWGKQIIETFNSHHITTVENIFGKSLFSNLKPNIQPDHRNTFSKIIDIFKNCPHVLKIKQISTSILYFSSEAYREFSSLNKKRVPGPDGIPFQLIELLADIWYN